MSLKYQNSELSEIHFRINFTADKRICTMFNYCRQFCTIKNNSQLLAFTSGPMQAELSFLNARAPLNRQRIKSKLMISRNPPIQKALLSQTDIRMSSIYSELYTKTMYKYIEKQFAAIAQSTF